MAVSYELLQPFYQNSVQVKHNVIGASTTLYRGSLAMNPTGGGGIVPFTRTGYALGAGMAGFPRDTYTNSLTGAVTRSSSMLFHRGCPFEADGNAGDLPLVTDIGSMVSMFDASTVTKTAVMGDLKVLLMELRPGGKYLVMLP